MTPFKILRLRETTLGGNHWLSESERLAWKTESNDIDVTSEDVTRQGEADFIVKLSPMQIRTFIIDINN